MEVKLRHLISQVEWTVQEGPVDIFVTQIAYDSRRVRPGGLFVAILGRQQDGHDYIQEALDRGAVAIVSEHFVPVPEGIHLTVVQDSRKALSKLSALFYEEPSKKMRLVGVTGTNGKTTTVAYLKSILDAAGYEAASIGTLGLCFKEKCEPLTHTTPESLELQTMLHDLAKKGTEAVAMEVSSHALALQRVDDILFELGVFTNLTHEHLDFHGDMEAYYQTKRRLFTTLSKTSIVNGDDVYGARLIRDLEMEGRPVWRYGVSKDFEVYATDVQAEPSTISFLLCIGAKKARVRIQLPGLYNAYNALAAAAAATAFGIDMNHVVLGLEKTAGVPGRFERYFALDGLQVVVDYAHTPDGLHQFINTVRPSVKGALWAVLGAPGERDHSKRPLMGSVLEAQGVTCVFTTDNPRSEDPFFIAKEIQSGFKDPSRTKIILDRKQAVEHAILSAGADDLVIITGKGNEHGQLIAGERLAYDEAEAVRSGLDQRDRSHAEDAMAKGTESLHPHSGGKA